MKENKIDRTGRLWVNQAGVDSGVFGSFSEEDDNKVTWIVLDGIEGIYTARFNRFPNLEKICVDVKTFYLDNLRGCKNLKHFHIADNGHANRSFSFIGEMPEDVAKNLTKTSWCDILKYRPDMFKQIPFALFEDQDFIKRAFDHIVIGMTDRVRVVEDIETFSKKKAEDELLLKEVKYRIGLARKTFAGDLEEHKKMCADVRAELFGLEK
ncbi:MAG: hypothetical protein J6J24_03055 [Clostridia bacterium]|nr:hypothetical protein [Clostridia bacterium]